MIFNYIKKFITNYISFKYYSVRRQYLYFLIVFISVNNFHSLTTILRNLFNPLSSIHFWRKCVSMTTFVIRGEPAVKREERRCRRQDYICRGGQHRRSGWFQAVRSGRGQGESGWMSMPHRHHRRPTPFGTRNRAIYRPSAGQPSYPIPPKGGKSRVPRENRVGEGRGTSGRDGERWMAWFPERWPSVSL